MERTVTEEEMLPVYDYVIVGGGSCGCVLAARLASASDRTVLLLEAGGDDRKIPEIPVPGSARLLQLTDCDWQYKAVAQQNAFKAFKDQVFNIPRGKVLGGSGSINYMIYMRGTPHDYDIWKNMGCPGWGYDDVLPYFMKSERCLINRLVDKGYRGTDGPMMISETKVTPLANVFLEAGKAMGYKETDCNGPDPIGFMLVQSNIADGVRQSSSEAYLRPVMKRENLHVALNCHVTKVLIDKQVARAVEFVRGSSRKKRQTVRARQEILLCGGTIGSAHLLMLSGIGPAHHLKSVGIDVVADLPVGDNLQDHSGTFGIEFQIDEPISVLPEDLACQERRDLYEKLRTGHLATNVYDAIGLIRSEVQDPGNPNPDICLTSLCSLYGAGHGTAFKAATGMRNEIWESMFCGNLGKHGFGVKIAVTHPKSRGTIRLRNPDPFSYPAIDYRCFSHPDDVATTLAGIKFLMKLGQTEPMKAIGARFTARVLPHCTKKPFTDAYWEEYIQTLTFMTYNIGGTCRMGRPEDSTTVVDPQLRVKGVERLRVIDASIIPVLPSASIYGPCLMIAEKAADIILGKHT